MIIKYRWLWIMLLFCLFFRADQKGETVCMLAETKRVLYAHSGGGKERASFRESLYYYFMVENAPKDRDELKELMLWNFTQSTHPLDSLSQKRDLEAAVCTFLRSTYTTRSYFADSRKNRYDWNDVYSSETYLGTFVVSRCEDDKNKFNIVMYTDLGTLDHRRFIECGPDEEVDTLYNACNAENPPGEWKY